MVALTDTNVDEIIQVCTANVDRLAESLSQCVDCPLQIEIGDLGSWVAGEVPENLKQPGLVTVFQLGDQGAACLVPAGVLLPDWYLTPNDDQRAKLGTLAVEWSQLLFPTELAPTRSAAIAVPDLGDFAHQSAPSRWAATIELRVKEGGQPRESMLLVWPLEQPQFPALAQGSGASPSAERGPPSARPIDPLARVRQLPVEISVRLAEKRIPVSQLLSITPGALITFNKSCEDLLDLYVNNALYCRGEAVKIGEKFGLKINQVGSTQQRQSKVVNG